MADEVLANPGIRVGGAPGDVDRTCPGCRTGHPTDHDGDPRHVVIGAKVETQMATLPNGQSVPVQTPVDVAYHFECHAAIGCDHCQEMLDHHGGSVKGKAKKTTGIEVPDHLVDLAPGEFESGEEGVLRRVKDKKTAWADHKAQLEAGGFKYVSPEKARQIHAEHQRAMAAGELPRQDAE